MRAASTPPRWLLATFVLGLAIGAGIGFLAAPSAAPRPESGEAETPRSPHDASPALIARGAAPESDAPLPGDVPGRSGDTDATEPAPPTAPEPPAGIAGWIRVELVPATGQTHASGMAYVLEAGAPGVDELERVPHAEVTSNTPGLIPIDRPGLYDVGFYQSGVRALEQDVEVIAGRTTTVRLEFPARAPIHVELEHGGSPLAGWTLHAGIRLSDAQDGRSVFCPGRGERASWAIGKNFSGSGSHVVGIAQVGIPWTVRCRLWLSRNKKYRAVSDRILVSDRQTVEAGQTIRCRIVPAGTLEIHGELDMPTWPVGLERTISLVVEHAGGEFRDVQGVARSATWKPEDRHTWKVPVAAGSARLHWTGFEMNAGSHEPVAVEAGQSTRMDIRLRYTGKVSASTAPLPFEVAWPKGVKDDELRLVGVIPEHDGRGIELGYWDRSPEDARPLDWRIRHARRLIGIIGNGYATGLLDVPTRDVLRIQPVLGGRLVVAPEVERPESMGKLRLRREDGLPLFLKDHEARVETDVELGSVLGPFVPGPHTFHVWRGTRRLPDVQVTVRAGRITPLVIPD